MTFPAADLPSFETSAPPAVPQRILVVDDVRDNREVLTRRLVRRGFEVVEANGGRAALEAVEAQRFDLVLLDIMMPDLSGNLVLQAIRRSHSQAELPVVMVTAKSDSADVVKCLEDGANDYVTKPVDFAVAFARIQAQLARKRAADERRDAERALETQVARQRGTLAESEERLRFLAFHDPLTQLPNRIALRERLEAMLRADASPASLLFLDLDHFKAVNDDRGHETGDAILTAVAGRIRDTLAPPSLAARLGGDEFAVLLVGEDAARTDEIAARIVEALCVPFEVPGGACEIGASCGTVDLRAGFRDLDEALNAADIAMYAAKAKGRRTVIAFRPDMLEERRRRRQLELDLRSGIQSGQLELHFQPLFAAATGRLRSFEALVRWRHPTEGLIPPAEFVPLAEETGLIQQLGTWVLREALGEAACWPEEVSIAVNVSPLQIAHGEMLPTLVNILAATGFAPERLELEITESSLLSLQAETVAFLRAVQELGVRVSIDDFGTGYSSMSYIQNFRFDKIKIDRSFVQAIGESGTGGAIVKAILDLSTTIGVPATAEGVETSAQLEYITANGCNEAQGFFFAPPMTRADTRRFIARSL